MKFAFGTFGVWKTTFSPLVTSRCWGSANFCPFVSTICKVTINLGSSATTTLSVAFFWFDELATRSTDPALTPTTLPFSIFAMPGLFETQVIVWSVAFDGITVTLGKALLSPTFRFNSVKERLSDCTGTSKTAWMVSFCVTLDSV